MPVFEDCQATRLKEFFVRDGRVKKELIILIEISVFKFQITNSIKIVQLNRSLRAEALLKKIVKK